MVLNERVWTQNMIVVKVYVMTGLGKCHLFILAGLGFVHFLLASASPSLLS